MLKGVRALAAFAVVAWLATPAAQGQTRVPYRAQVTKTCQAAAVCTVQFPVVPAKRRIELEQVSCLTQVTNGTTTNAYIYTAPAPTLFHYLIPGWERSSGGTTTISFEASTGIFASPGQRFVAEHVGSPFGASSFITCALYGETVILP